eukprot:CAMPEP_0198512790 /NCGR_PEP_ID=MMETSP1462-20131121/15664_1 /TAXON_ID=1333877 /ORGANISM="Brandtodinium nutriculum, Strain RCC3387" /LENGTH=50 /DNA_ID=CAMNT_0044242201 /DNA_START=105 /DNA_END=254 /DNA_ORIENTATION=-
MSGGACHCGTANEHYDLRPTYKNNAKETNMLCARRLPFVAADARLGNACE